MNFIFTSDDAGSPTGADAVERFEMVLDWLSERGIPATFFWIPKVGGRPSDGNHEWIDAIRRARRDGHDFQLHGLTHYCLEFGVPQESIRRHAPKMFEEYDRDPGKWQREHTAPNLRKKFEEGLSIYERALGERLVIFRAPCLGICDAAYEAMFECGIRYSSSRSINPAATGYFNTREPALEPWQPDYGGRPFHVAPGVLEIPCLEDIVIKGLRSEDSQLALDLFKRDITNYLQALGDWPFGVFSSHYHSIARSMPVVTDLYERLFDWLAQQGVSQWVTFKTAIRSLGAEVGTS